MLASGIKLGLVHAGYAVDWVSSGERAEDVLRGENFDAAIVDLGLPGIDGLQLTRRLRHEGQTLPILVLTARDGLEDRVQGLDTGADDYMVKPYELPELLARLRALLRRSQAATSAVLSFGPLEMDQAGRTASINGRFIDLIGREWTVMEYMLLHAPRPVSKQHLLQALTGFDRSITPNAVEVYVSRLRAKLEPHGIALPVVRGFGYRVAACEPPTRAESAADPAS